jgi:hypothetical protein
MNEHVKQWRQAEAIEHFGNRDRMKEALIASWYEKKWTATMAGHKVTGDLKGVDDYAYVDGNHIEPSFTLEFNDPDYPDGFPLTLTGHFSRFEPK